MMYSRIRYPDRVPPAELDEYLEAGWRCTGQAIYTSHFMRFPPDGGGRVYSTIPTRLPLSGYAFSKRLRKQWRRVHRRFRVETGAPFQWDEATARVHEAYTQCFPDRPLADLETYLAAPCGPFTFDTRCVRVYDGNQLVAFSVFNLGKRSIYSSQGIYDPEFHKYSLGFFTMLAEIEYGKEQGRLFFYPGYIVPGYSEFDYKQRIGELEYFLLSEQRWLPSKDFSETQAPVTEMRHQLSSLKGRLKSHGVDACLSEYTLFDIRFFDSRPLPFLEFPLVLLIETSDPAQLSPLVVYHPVEQAFGILNSKFFGIGVHHVPTYLEIMAQKPASIGFPIAVVEILKENTPLESALQYLSTFL